MSSSGIGQFIPLILLITLAVVWIQVAKKARTKEVEQYNKKYNKNFKTWEELEKYRKIEMEKIIEKEEKAKKEKKRTEKEKIVEDEEEENVSLMSKVKRLKSLYNNGTLTKAEFEQAKNKLLK